MKGIGNKERAMQYLSEVGMDDPQLYGLIARILDSNEKEIAKREDTIHVLRDLLIESLPYVGHSYPITDHIVEIIKEVIATYK